MQKIENRYKKFLASLELEEESMPYAQKYQIKRAFEQGMRCSLELLLKELKKQDDITHIINMSNEISEFGRTIL